MSVPLVDCRGMNCPLPILHIRLRINELAAGDELIAWCTDPTFERDIERFCFLASLNFLGKTPATDYTEYRFKLKEISHL